MNDNLQYTLRLNRSLFKKFKHIAEYDGRSVNKEIEHYIRKHVAKFEKEHGEILKE